MSAQEPTGARIEEEDVQQLRLALIMSGGVSLAVWMGGVAHEFHRVTRADGPVYSGLLQLTASKARIDVISGTSAGGLNGALLAMAIVHDSTIGGLRDLWLRLGSLETLLRPATDKDPPSLLRGDDYFAPEIAKALEGLQSGSTRPDETPMDLTVTTTLLRARPQGTLDNFGTIVQDADHRGEFRFQRGTRVISPGLDTTPQDDFADPDIVAKLALASRATASFPFAFEATYCPSNPASGASAGRPDLSAHANFELSRYVIDGGILVNRPVRPALRSIFAQPAGPQVRRVLAYVVPDPGQGKKDTADELTDVPELAEIAFASLIRLPRNQSVGQELAELNEHNARVDAQRRRRELAVAALDLEGFAAGAYPQYRQVRGDRLADWLFRALARWLTALELRRPAEVSDTPLWQRGTLKGYLVTHLRDLPPGTFPAAGQPVTDWFTTVDTVERAGSVVLDLLRRGLGVTDPGEPRTEDIRRELQTLRTEVHALMRYARSLREAPTDDQGRAYAQLAMEALEADDPPVALGGWADDVLPKLLGDRAALTPLAEQIADRLVPAVRVVIRACAAAPDHLRPRADAIRPYAEGVGRGLDSAGAHRHAALQRLLALEVVELALGGEPVVEQQVELIQISADAGNGFDATRQKPDDKLAGLQLGHFGAFYKRSWRANDWMWGRLDGAQRLTQVLLEPSRLRQQGFSASSACAAIGALALGEPDGEERETLEDRAWPDRWDAEGALKELAFLDDPGSPLPDSLPICAQALSRRLQLQILLDELGPVADAVRWDADADAAVSPDAAAFERAEAAARPLTPTGAVSLFQRCLIGQERLPAESGSDLLARVVSRALAVGTAAASGASMGLPLRAQRVLHALRGIALVLHLFVAHALARTRAGASLAAAALVAGAALVAVGLLVRIPGILLLLGAALLLGGIVLAAYRRRWKVPWTAIVAAALIVVSVRVAAWTWDAIDDGSQRPGWLALLERMEPVVVVAGLVVGAHLLGKTAVHWPEKERR